MSDLDFIRQESINNQNEYDKGLIDFYHYKYKELRIYQRKHDLLLKALKMSDLERYELK